MRRILVVALVVTLTACLAGPFVRQTWLSARLVQAVRQRDCKQVRAALNAGADPNATPRDDYPVLSRAVLQWDECMVSSLIAHGATVNPKDKWAPVPLLVAIDQYYEFAPTGCREGVDDSKAEPIGICGSYRMIQFLIAPGADVHAKYGNKTLLQYVQGEREQNWSSNPKLPPPPWKDEVIPLLKQAGAN